MRRIAISVGRLVWGHTPWLWLRKLYFAAFLRVVRNRKTIATTEGVTFDLDLGEMIDVSILLEQFERDVADAIESICRPGWNVLDIGANIGAHCLRLAKVVGQEGAVYAFEPTDYAFSKLKRNVSLNPFQNINLYQLAFSNENVTGKTIECRSSWRTDGVKTVQSAVVEFIRLDDWMERESVAKVDLVKLDVDGAEFQILDGGRRVIDRYRPVVLIEVGAWHFLYSDENPLRILADMGYRFWCARTGYEYASLSDVRAALPEMDKDMAYSVNVVASVDEPRLWLSGKKRTEMHAMERNSRGPVIK
jgi:FkbM family methyltransferase